MKKEKEKEKHKEWARDTCTIPTLASSQECDGVGEEQADVLRDATEGLAVEGAEWE